MEEYEISFDELQITDFDVIKEIGYSSYNQDSFIIHQVGIILSNLSSEIKPKFIYKIFCGNVDLECSQVRLKYTDLEVGKMISFIMKDLAAFAVFAATVGNEFDVFLKKKAEKSMKCLKNICSMP